MLRRFKYAIMAIFFATLTGIILWVSVNQPRVMVLHSYSKDYIWTRGVNVGLERALANQSWLDVRFHYMKTKKKSDKAYLRRTGIAARRAIDSIKPDVLIAIDDNAQKLAAKYYINNPKTKIVFAGINGSIKPYGYTEADNVTGILERKPIKAIKEIISLIGSGKDNEGNLRAQFLSDNSHSAERDGKYLASQDWSPIIFQGHVALNTFDEWKTFVGSLSGKTDFLLVGAYRKLYRDEEARKKRKDFMSSKEVGAWTEANSPVPVIGMNVFNTNDGIMISVGVSPYEQGEVAGNMAIDIIRNGTRPKDIPIKISEQYVVSMSRSALEKRKVDVPNVIEAFAKATNNYFK